MTISDACADLGERQPVSAKHANRECAEDELTFWRRKAAERATALTAERAKNQRLTLRILELLEEDS